MRKEISTCNIENSASKVAEDMVKEKASLFIVIRNVKDKAIPLGVVTRSDIVFRVVAAGRDPRKTPIKYIFSAPVITIYEYNTVEELSEVLHTKGVRNAVVIDEDNNILGICGEEDIIKSVGKDKNTDV